MTSRTARRPHVAYVLSRFPKLSETFVIMEIVTLQRQGFTVSIYPYIAERSPIAHREVDEIGDRVVRLPRPAALHVAAAQLYWLVRRPIRYGGAWATVLRELWRSPGQLARALVTIPRSAWFARRMVASGVTHVHAHFSNHPALGALVVGRLTGLPYSFTAHAHDLFVDRRMLCTKVAESAFTVTISEYNRALIARDCPTVADRVRVIHCGVDLSLFDARPAAPADRLRLVCVGTLEPKKGQRHLVDAVGLLRERGIGVMCTLIGDGPDRASLEARIASLGLADSVTLAGGLPREEVARGLAAADVAVLPSVPLASGRMEGIPVSLMEAMACGLPVVSTSISGIPELVDDGRSGLLVPPGDAGALADALARLAHDPDMRQRMGQEGRARIVESFELDRCVAELGAEIAAVGARR